MFSKCIYCDKLHICTSREKYGKPFKTNLSWCDLIREAILHLIPEDTRLKDLFLRWSLLGPAERASIDEQIQTRDHLDLYTPLKEALERWENVQDTQGAPGFEPGVYSFSCDSRLEEELLNVIYKMDHLVEAASSRTLVDSEQREEIEISCLYLPTQQWTEISGLNTKSSKDIGEKIIRYS